MNPWKGLQISWISSWFFLILLLAGFTDSTHDCHSGVIVNDVCYYMGSGLYNWMTAEEACRDEGGYLAAVKDASAQEAIATLARNNRFEEFWIGGREQESQTWMWLDGYVFIPQGCYNDNPRSRDLPIDVTAAIPYLSNGQRNTSAENCIKACQDTNSDYKYAGTQNGTHCFCGTSFGSYGTNKTCTVDCTGETKDSLSLWCGGINMNFIYYLGGGGGYAYFAYHQPNNYNSYQNCAIVDLHLETKMADESCMMKFPFICDTSICSGTGYHRLNNTGRDCVYIGRIELNYYQAKAKCANDHGGQLLSLNKGGDLELSKDKHRALRVLLENQFPDRDLSKFYIGAEKSTWFWVTPGVPFLYTAFAPLYPNDQSHQCLKFGALNTRNPDSSAWQYGWMDDNCFAEKRFLCQGGSPHISGVSSTIPSSSVSSTSSIPPPTPTSNPNTPSTPASTSSSNSNTPSTSPTRPSSSSSSSSSSPSSVSTPSGVSTPTPPSSSSPASSSPGGNVSPSNPTPSTPGNGGQPTDKPEEPTTLAPSTTVATTGGSQNGTDGTNGTGSSVASTSASPAPPPTTTARSSATSQTTSSSTPQTSTPTRKSEVTTSGIKLNTPDSGASTENVIGSLSILELLLIILLGILGLVILIVIIVLCCVFCKGRNTKVYAKGYDARPIAPVPNSGMEPNYDEFASTLSLNKYGPY